MATLKDWNITHPDEVGASEYRAIYECIDDGLQGCEEDVADDPRVFALAMLDEFTMHAAALRVQITRTEVK